ncbi:hypothetical protein JD844_016643 [Phrynosoma platyrhinos]|uniref:RING-type domain-containing protein n=1 Tax=Phrynosoma platyrhinos TaxID=52577 RepID=A0ABQ7SKN0_PHRPL|nr:hypothetical protein JD844_016643 [Phrynosoma platyrhinos]
MLLFMFKFLIVGLQTFGNYRSRLLRTPVHGEQRRKFVVESAKQNIPTDGWSASLQTEAAGQVLCRAASHLARTDKVCEAELNSQWHLFFLHIEEDLLSGNLQCSSEHAIELSALLAQLKFGDYNQNTAKYHYEEFCAKELTTDVLERIAYPVVQMATQSGKNVYLTITKESGNSIVHLFKMISTRAASGLYRAITETHAFYRCDTVTSAVMMQYSRDLKGHLASLFLNENINLGKKYVFDIKRTSKEAYDHARRALYNAGIVDLVSRGDQSPPSSPLKSSESNMNCESCEGLNCQQTKALQEKLRKLKESLLCMLCCEEEINSTFCPCGHTVCCESCAAQLQSCPVCRSRVEHVQHVYLPTHTSLLNLTVI